MISDVLSEAVEEIDVYLSEDEFRDVYSGTLRESIVDLRNRMEVVRLILDTPPTCPVCVKLEERWILEQTQGN